MPPNLSSSVDRTPQNPSGNVPETRRRRAWSRGSDLTAGAAGLPGPARGTDRRQADSDKGAEVTQ